ncbi:transcriptional regulator ATRX homolog [Ambystoma mexicanum]|uniref:transcriptional regulator ATRX homolog n=1 Tax=Ambystoma mexicanum TaxID=8296 RepID=UPI0037E853D9
MNSPILEHEKEATERDKKKQERDGGNDSERPQGKKSAMSARALVHIELVFVEAVQEPDTKESATKEAKGSKEKNLNQQTINNQQINNNPVRHDSKESGLDESMRESEIKRKLDLENELSDAEILGAVQENSSVNRQRTSGIEVVREGPPEIGLSQILLEKRNAAKAIWRQIEEREESRRLSTLKEQQEAATEGRENTSKTEDDHLRQEQPQEKSLQNQTKAKTSLQPTLSEEGSDQQKQMLQQKDPRQNVSNPDWTKVQLNSGQLLRTPEKVRDSHGSNQQREGLKEQPKRALIEGEPHRTRLSDSLFIEAMATLRKVASTPESPKNRRLSKIATPTQKESPSKKTDLLTIMSAITIALAPYCKLYEAIKEGIQDNGPHSEERVQEDLRNIKNQSESQNGEIVDICEKEQEIKEVNEESAKRPQLYPIKSGLLNQPQRKAPVKLKLPNSDKLQKSTLDEQVKQQEQAKLKEKKGKKNKETQEDTPRSTKRKKMRSSPQSSEDFMSDTNLMNLSQHWETASNNSVIEVITDQQTKVQNELEKGTENTDSLKAETSKGIQNVIENQGVDQ